MARDANTDAPITAVLGPTNTGKTHLAIDRMLAHADGMIGLPLRLLAREVYDKVVKAKGKGAAALVTGEEKIWPDTARYFICTVEAMPLDRRTQFLAVDEIQLARDPDRGHVFTDRLLRARGTGETYFMGSDTMRPMIRRLLPEAQIVGRERLSTLGYAGARKLTKLPRRTAIVAFSAEEVYAIAELIRRIKGGAAVVMGALSPRTRNAQVGLYQSGEVDFLVATDAIGMGLNMDVDHIAFASCAKFDGRRNRVLRPDEIAQIAGRAGRFRTDGTFGETGDCPPFDEETLARVQSHQFEPVTAIEWRTAELDFSSLRGLLRSLEAPPPGPGLMRTRGTSDEAALRRLAEDEDLAERVRRPADLRRLWEVCCTPDFRKVTVDEHVRLIADMAGHLLGPTQRLPQDWMAREIKQLDRSDGDLDMLQARLAHIRTWTYAANRPDWIDDCEHWRVRTREVEDKLSDALHAILTQRFIDRRTSALIRGLKREDAMPAAVDPAGEVVVEGHVIGHLVGLEFKPDPKALGLEGKAVRNAALRALAPEVERRLKAIAAGASATLTDDAGLVVDGAVVARLAQGVGLLRPAVQLIGADTAAPPQREAARAWLERQLTDDIRTLLAPLWALSGERGASALPRTARGLAFRVVEAGGLVDWREVAELVRALDAEGRAGLSAAGLRIGRLSIYAPTLIKPRAARLLAILRQVATGQPGPPPVLPPHGPVSIRRDPAVPDAAYVAVGFRPLGPLAVRVDRLERLALQAAQQAETAGGFVPDATTGASLGQPLDALAPVLQALGFRRIGGEAAGQIRWRPPQLGVKRRAQQGAVRTSLGAALSALARTPPDGDR